MLDIYSEFFPCIKHEDSRVIEVVGQIRQPTKSTELPLSPSEPTFKEPLLLCFLPSVGFKRSVDRFLIRGHESSVEASGVTVFREVDLPLFGEPRVSILNVIK